MFRICVVAMMCVSLLACKSEKQSVAKTPNVIDRSVVADPNSYAQSDKVLIEHIRLNLAVNIPQKILKGTADLELKWLDKEAKELILDTRDLRIHAIQGGDGKTWRNLKYKLASADPDFGSALHIRMSTQLKRVRISYQTSPNASGLQWLTPEMTSSKQPFMFSQSQAIHARSWVPLQDTPGVRFTYEASIKTDPSLMALMSADNAIDAKRDGDYQFNMPQKIPSYLLAIAVGDLVFQPISSRSGVWAEPSVATAARAEFIDTEKMIQVAEKLYGPYQWGRYDMLILPASFPFGGMENPRLSFITPTVIVGDKSLTSLIAHELAHSWSGNLVTNSSWKDMWLNEGFTSYVENRIVEEVYGREQAEMEQVISQFGLRTDIVDLANEDQLLALAPLVGKNPDDALTSVPYIKGQWFLMFLEQRFGRETFDAFLRLWFTTHAFTSTHSEEFERFITLELLEKNPGKVSVEEVAEWMHKPGIPSIAEAAKSKRFDKVDKQQEQWATASKKAAELDTKTWTTHEWVRFIEKMPEKLSIEQVVDLDGAFKFTGTANPEIAQRWYPLTVRSNYVDAQPAIEAFLIRVGRRKLIMPTYSELAKTPEGRAFAQSVFDKARPGYHPITTDSVTKVLAV
ncbi:MAG TPA: M1 family metallopeptidase, partial [Arenimonas sp.]|nr:M1 family metallopeptidase [Arenimonas sp.]